MSFEERLKNDIGFADSVRRSVKIDNMSPEELLDLPLEAIQNFSEEELGDAMEKIMHGVHHLVLDNNQRSSFDPRWHKYITSAYSKS